ncbi:MAG: membrane integrity-associated transporter subunit PqiC, partial [Candidatus Marinimicrobia bacterium]|nr:membrane integrity-associated transporter subunit PqiC [Candidatus Neomarinimicrobiota bacterium]
MNKIYLKIIFVSILLSLFYNCSSQKQSLTNHYVLEYYSHLEREELEQNEPFPYSVIIKDPIIPVIYDRRQIVIRHFGPRITYADNDLWAVPLSEIIPQLINTRFNRYKIFNLAQREFLNQRPEFEIVTDIRYVEALKFENKMQARLVMDFYLRKAGEENYIIKHSVNKEESLIDNNLENFVQKVNDLILKETDDFAAKIIRYFKYGESATTVKGVSSEIIAAKDSTVVNTGEGLLVLPAITKTENEPYFNVFNEDNERTASGKMGEAVKLSSGYYTVKYGSGTERQMISRRGVKISPRYKTVIEPDWGCLII